MKDNSKAFTLWYITSSIHCTAFGTEQKLDVSVHR